MRARCSDPRAGPWGRRSLVLVLAGLALAAAMAPSSWAAEGDEDKAKATREVAVGLYKEGKFAQSAELYHRAHRLDPKPVYLFNAARAEQRALKLDLAERDYRAVLQSRRISEKMRAKADLYLKEIATTRAALKKVRAEERAKAERAAASTPAPGVSSPTPAPRPGWRTPAGWGLAGVSAITVVAGLWLQINAAGRVKDINARVNRYANGSLNAGEEPLTKDAYDRQYDSAATRARYGQGLLGLGILAAGGSAWLLIKGRGDVALLPHGRGATLALRF